LSDSPNSDGSQAHSNLYEGVSRYVRQGVAKQLGVRAQDLRAFGDEILKFAIETETAQIRRRSEWNYIVQVLTKTLLKGYRVPDQNSLKDEAAEALRVGQHGQEVMTMFRQEMLDKEPRFPLVTFIAKPETKKRKRR